MLQAWNHGQAIVKGRRCLGLLASILVPCDSPGLLMLQSPSRSHHACIAFPRPAGPSCHRMDRPRPNARRHLARASFPRSRRSRSSPHARARGAGRGASTLARLKYGTASPLSLLVPTRPASEPGNQFTIARGATDKQTSWLKSCPRNGDVVDRPVAQRIRGRASPSRNRKCYPLRRAASWLP